MVYKNKRRYRSRKGTKRSSVSSLIKRKKRTNQNFRKKVLGALHAETKTIKYTVSTVLNSSASSAGVYPGDLNLIPCHPTPAVGALTIAQGTGQGNRVGNRIFIKRTVFSFKLIPEDYTGSNAPMPYIIRTMFIYDKRNPLTQPTPMINGDFFQSGNSTTGFTNGLQDLIMPYNRDRYVIKHVKDYKIGFASYNGMTGVPANEGYYTNNDFKLIGGRTVNVTKDVIHRIVYNDTSTNQQWRGFWFFAYAVSALPTAYPPYNTNTVELHANLEIDFTDI